MRQLRTRPTLTARLLTAIDLRTDLLVAAIVLGLLLLAACEH